ncbi:MAG: GDSL-type esterase/lipase family protein [Pseudomonadota bacterium]|nr:GDSL-type esterase/lipase family protein [Pseudomonadota bacterium]
MLVVIAAMLEQGARLVGAEFPEWRLTDAAGVVMTGHPTRLWGLSPGVKQNGGVVANINALGMRGAPPEDPKPPGKLRVLVVGDSTFFGHGVSDDETFPAQLQARLRAEGLEVDVLNAGVPGYSTEQTRIQLDEEGWALAPDLLIVGNLWSDNNVDSFRDEDLLRTARAREENPLFASYFFRLLATAVDQARGGDGARLVTWTRKSQWPEKGGRRVSLRRYGENLDTIAREAASRGIGTAFISPCNSGLVVGKYPDGASWDVFFSAQRTIAAHHGVPLMETLPALRAATMGDPTPLFVDIMHPSALGHAVFAEVADTALREAGWPTNRLLASGGVFPVETLNDSRFGIGHANPRSPQRNLFGDGELGAPPKDDYQPDQGTPARPKGADSTSGASTGAPGAATTGPDATAPDVTPPPDARAPDAQGTDTTGPRWALSGSVGGGRAPYRVDVHAPGGAIVTSVRLDAAGPFDVRVRGDVTAVDIVVTDALGVTRTTPGGPERGPVDIKLP